MVEQREEFQAKKQFTYRGKTLEELKALGVREFAKYIKSNERRSILRQFQKIEEFINRCKEKLAKKKQIRTHSRGLIIVPEMVGMRVFVHNGKGFEQVDISESMIGHRLGEFALTRSKVKHSAAGIGATRGTRSKAK